MLFDAGRHLILPALTPAYVQWALILTVTRSSMLDVIRQDYDVLACKGERRESRGILPGEFAVYLGTHVSASNGNVGLIEEFLITDHKLNSGFHTVTDR